MWALFEAEGNKIESSTVSLLYTLYTRFPPASGIIFYLKGGTVDPSGVLRRSISSVCGPFIEASVLKYTHIL